MEISNRVTNNEIELLAPCGSYEAVMAAVKAGANAVYIGGKQFSARSRASNFTDDEIKKATEFCHSRKVKIYVAVNTLIKNQELSSVLVFLSNLARIGVDALIVQDIGVYRMVRKLFPNFPLHASTQMAIHTKEGVKFLEESGGIKRVVLARELSKSEIEDIVKSTNLEVEVFVHGSQCVSVSGQCYFSALLGERSANRGTCAGPCRLPFTHDRIERFGLSLKDMALIFSIKELCNMGVKSLKIEGRMKTPEYVGAVVTVYRKALDNIPIELNDILVLRDVFCRSGFTDGYYTGKRDRYMFGARTPEDLFLDDKTVVSDIRGLYKTEIKRFDLNFNLEVKKGEAIKLIATSEDKKVEVSGDVPEQAINKPLSIEICEQQLKKIGNNQYECKDITCSIEDGLSLPVASINSVRRKAITRLDKKFISSGKRSIKILGSNKEYEDILFDRVDSHEVTGEVKRRASFSNLEIPDMFSDFELLYVPLFSDLKTIEEYKKKGFNIALRIPRVLFDINIEKIKSYLKDVKSIGINDVLVSNLGAINIAKELEMNMHGGFELNIINRQSLMWAYETGFSDVEVLFELSAKEIGELGEKIKRGVFAYGRVPLMTTRSCQEGIKVLIDRKNVKFPVTHSYGYSEILNSVPMYILEGLPVFNNIDFTTMYFTIERVKRITDIMEKDFERSEFTKAIYTRGVL